MRVRQRYDMKKDFKTRVEKNCISQQNRQLANTLRLVWCCFCASDATMIKLMSIAIE